jgi:hypothetical protein
MIKKEDRAFLDENLRGHIFHARDEVYVALEAVCLRGQPEDLEAFRAARERYAELLKAQTLLTDGSA